jgi:decaprenylphospho-beta-D-erythro-pentofuranosid-2-ulose 2-reductase
MHGKGPRVREATNGRAALPPPGRHRAVVVGGSAGLGRALCEELASKGYDLVIGARHPEDLDAVTADVRVRYSVAATPLPIDLCGSAETVQDYAAECFGVLGGVDAVLIPAGAVDDTDDGTAPWSVTTPLVETNFLGVATLAAAFVERFETQGRGTIVLFSSIAAAAPRGRNVVYGAAKAALEHYGRSLQHRLAGGNVRVQIYALGYVDTAMTAGRRLLVPPADPRRIARTVVSGLDRDRRFTYLPRYWRAVVTALRLMPWPIYRRLDF